MGNVIKRILLKHSRFIQPAGITWEKNYDVVKCRKDHEPVFLKMEQGEEGEEHFKGVKLLKIIMLRLLGGT
jgi:hypothetical protein